MQGKWAAYRISRPIVSRFSLLWERTHANFNTTLSLSSVHQGNQPSAQVAFFLAMSVKEAIAPALQGHHGSVASHASFSMA